MALLVQAPTSIHKPSFRSDDGVTSESILLLIHVCVFQVLQATHFHDEPQCCLPFNHCKGKWCRFHHVQSVAFHSHAHLYRALSSQYSSLYLSLANLYLRNVDNSHAADDNDNDKDNANANDGNNHNNNDKDNASEEKHANVGFDAKQMRHVISLQRFHPKIKEFEVASTMTRKCKLLSYCQFCLTNECQIKFGSIVLNGPTVVTGDPSIPFESMLLTGKSCVLI
ncbi:deubiquinating/deneddylating enzyme, partial [Reticulomyxa filosa]